MKYDVELKKKKKILEKGRACQEDLSNKKIEISTWPQESPK